MNDEEDQGQEDKPHDAEDIVLLDDLEPLQEVKGGASRFLFGQSTKASGPKKPS